MAKKPAYIVRNSCIEKIMIEYKYFSGFSLCQKQKSIYSLHSVITSQTKISRDKILEVSTKSPNQYGVKLSAFNLGSNTKEDFRYTVETAFQGAKVFEFGGPYSELVYGNSYDAKKDTRIKDSGKLTGFEIFSRKFPLEPKTAFYDWLYINTLLKNPELCEKIMDYTVFTDIEFNHEKSINTQSFSAALFVKMRFDGVDMSNFGDFEYFVSVAKKYY